MPSASAISVTVWPAVSACAIRARRPWRRSSAVGLGCDSSVIGVVGFLTRANRRDEFVRLIRLYLLWASGTQTARGCGFARRVALPEECAGALVFQAA